jgi:hypothetical protein
MATVTADMAAARSGAAMPTARRTEALDFALWLRNYRFGRVEWLWRCLTYMKRQPMRRPTGGVEV